MKVTHICLASFFNDNHSYQENLLTRCHKEMGLDVSVIAGLDVFNDEGKLVYLQSGSRYINENRISKAKHLLDTGSYTNEEIAALCGFADVKYFYVVFRKLTGQTTRQYVQWAEASFAAERRF